MRRPSHDAPGMANNRYYYYDHESCSFVEWKGRRRRLQVHLVAIALVGLVLSGILTWGMDRLVQTPEELALRTENQALQRQLAQVSRRMETISSDLAQLSETDQELYRSLLQADPIPSDIRQVGVGGSDPYAEFDRFSASASSLLRSSSRQLDRLERQLGLQRDSYRELTALAGEHAEQLNQLPAILPTNGKIVSGFGVRTHPILKIRRMHNGLDIHVAKGTPVVSAADGVVLDVDRGNGFGNYVKIQHPASGYVTLYAHLTKAADGLKKGQRVTRGQVIAFSGNSGLSSAPHLHYEVLDMEGRSLNPIFFFAPSMTPSEYQKLLAESEASTVSFD